VGVDTFDGLEPIDFLRQSPGRVNRVQREIGELEDLRASVTSGGPVLVSAAFGSGKTGSYIAAVLRKVAGARSLQPPLLRPGSRVSTANWETSAGASLTGVNASTLAVTATTSMDHRSPGALAEAIPPYRPAHPWLRLAGMSLPGPLASWEQQEMAVSMLAWPAADGAWSRSELRIVDECHGYADFGEFCALLGEAQPVTLLVYLDRVQQVRDGVLRLINGALRVRRHAVGLLRIMFTRSPDVCAFALILIAASRRYGRRGDPDGHALPVDRLIPVIGGEPALSH
jgi:hypothetical protein